jgi:MoxR-like ATPase
VLLLQQAVADIYIDELLGRWVVELVHATRVAGSTAVGASVRGSLALERAARAWALMHERDYVVPGDIERLFLPVLGHRVVFTPAKLAEARQHGMTSALASFRSECFRHAPPPVLELDELEPEQA